MMCSDLADILGRAPEDLPQGEATGVTEDSRRVIPGALFFALEGHSTDGHAHADSAAAKGALAIVGERTGMETLAGVPYIRVDNARKAFGLAAHRLAGEPAAHMKVIGVTGTNGKTSTVQLIRHLLEASGASTAAFGTIGNSVAGKHVPATHTTATAEALAAMLAEARAAGQQYAVMEASSHALEQERVAGIPFAAAVFTNLTQDHLDYHADMEQYLQTKLKLFRQATADGAFTVVNAEDAYAPRFREASAAPVYAFGKKGDVRAKSVKLTAEESSFRVVSPWGEGEVHTGLLGRHNVSNILAALCTAGGLGIDFAAAAHHVGDLQAIPGRFERIDAGQPFQVIVDYAHTDDGLRNVLQAARAICDGRVLLVFGCGGDRDRTKRPKMAAVAAELADYAIITSDNPRTEDPERIVLDVETGIQRAGKKKGDDYDIIIDRATAIERIIALAKRGDLVLIAGKGHEDYQILGTERIHFDDREVARTLLEAR